MVIAGGPDLGRGAMAERLEILRHRYDWLRSSTVNEPRGSGALVGALLCEPENGESAAGVLFFNDAGYLGMCGHGAIGLAVTLAFLGKLRGGRHRLETPVGDVTFTLHGDNRVSIDNVASYRYRADVTLDVPAIGELRGDIAWGGNWFFLVADHGQSLEHDNAERLTDFTRAIRRALAERGIRGPEGEPIEHIELFGPPSDPAKADSRNFVLCPGKAYDRSPCGTGTSARIACLLEDGQLAPGDIWRQESITGSVFEVGASVQGGQILPVITGSAYVTGDGALLLDPADPFRYGLSVKV